MNNVIVSPDDSYWTSESLIGNGEHDHHMNDEEEEVIHPSCFIEENKEIK